MANISINKLKGLHTFQNFFSSIPEGALTDATNVVIDRDNIIEPRRGIKQYGDFGLTADRAKQLLEYKSRVLVHYGSKLAYDNGTGVFSDFIGTFNDVQSGLRLKGVELNGNYFITTNSGIKKISANTTDLSFAIVSDAGGVKALDGTANMNFSTPGFLPGYSKVAYRIVWGTKDINDNLILGSPSTRIIVTNFNPPAVTGNVDLTFTVPNEINTNYFYQIYRTSVSSALTLTLLDEVDPGDEMRLVYEAAITSGEITAGIVNVTDITSEDFQIGGTLLYTNPVSGEGILQANEKPPVAKDIAIFKNSVFFANTRTRHRLDLNLLGLSEIRYANISAISAANPAVITSNAHGLTTGDRIVIVGTSGTTGVVNAEHVVTVLTTNTFSIPVDGTGATADPSGNFGTWFSSYITTSDGFVSNRYFFVGRSEVTKFVFDTKTNTADGSWFEISSAENLSRYVIWFDKTGTTSAPSAGTNKIYIRVDISALGAGVNVAPTVQTAVETATNDFVVSESPAGTLTFITSNNGQAVDAVAGSTPPGGVFAITIMQQGFGEDTTKKYIRLSGFVSVGQAVDDSARSMVKVINLNASDVIYGYYLSGPDDIPGIMNFESRLLNDNTFTFIANNSFVGSLFNPDITTVASSSDEETANRVYFSKYQQPEAVPLLNYVDIGPKDKAILRIVALRDSLIIFKEDGIYRLTGEVSPNFSVILFDNSVQLIAPDSCAITNNQIYCLTDGGIATVSDTGVGVISRPIENVFTRISTDNFPNFSTATFGISSETDRAYFIWTVTNTTDTFATQCFRYNTFTQTWVRWDNAQTCGLSNPEDSKLYFGSPDSNFIDVERKSLTRKDYADKEYELQFPSNSLLSSNTILISSTENVAEGDALVQTQYVTINQFNSLLHKLDMDPRIALTPGSFDTNYFDTLELVPSESLSSSLSDLVTKLNSDPGTRGLQNFNPSDVDTSTDTITISSHGLFNNQAVRFTTTGTLPGGVSALTTYFVKNVTTNTFQLSATSGGSTLDITTQGSGIHTVAYYVFSGTNVFSAVQIEYNRIITALNNDPRLKFTNYQLSTGTIDFEMSITDFNTNFNTIEVSEVSQYVVGPVTLFKGIQSTIVWAPVFYGDPALLKHVRESTIMFEASSFRGGQLGFSSDLSPSFETIDFSMDGNGVWGGFSWGDNLWGGAGSSVPFRTYIPRQKQRCRFLRTKFHHDDAFYIYSILGISFAFEINSERAYRGK